MIPFRPKTRVLEAIVFGSLLLGISVPRAHAQGRLQRTVDTETRPRVGMNSTSDDQEGVNIRHKLATIIIPSVEFHSTTLEDAIEFLRQESRRLDPDPDPQSRGINITLRLPAVAQTAAGSQTMAQASQTNSTVSPANPLFDPTVPSIKPRITLAMNRIPLLEALKYVAVQAGLKVRLDPYAVTLVPFAENTDAMITAVFRVSPNFIGNKSNDSGTSALDQASASAH